MPVFLYIMRYGITIDQSMVTVSSRTKIEAYQHFKGLTDKSPGHLDDNMGEEGCLGIRITSL